MSGRNSLKLSCVASGGTLLIVMLPPVSIVAVGVFRFTAVAVVIGWPTKAYSPGPASHTPPLTVTEKLLYGTLNDAVAPEREAACAPVMAFTVKLCA